MHNDSDIYNFDNERIPDPEKWNRERVVLFEKYCLNSIMNQTCHDFVWVLAFSRKTPPEIYEPYMELPNVRIIFDTHPFTYMQTLCGNELKIGEWVITTRLDNDDSVHPSFVQDIQDRFSEEYKLIDFKGCQYDVDAKKFHAAGREYPNSPFISIVEKVGEFDDFKLRTCYYKSHTHFHTTIKSEMHDDIRYCQIIHGNNIVNKIVGKEIEIENEFFKE